MKNNNLIHKIYVKKSAKPGKSDRIEENKVKKLFILR